MSETPAEQPAEPATPAPEPVPVVTTDPGAGTSSSAASPLDLLEQRFDAFVSELEQRLSPLEGKVAALVHTIDVAPHVTGTTPVPTAEPPHGLELEGEPPAPVDPAVEAAAAAASLSDEANLAPPSQHDPAPAAPAPEAPSTEGL